SSSRRRDRSSLHAMVSSTAWSEERSRRRELERMEEAKQNFTDMLVHDLTSRMSSISMSLKMLEKNVDLSDPRTSKLMDTISSSSKRMLTQINALLDIRKIQEGRMNLHPEVVRLTDFLLNNIDEFKPACDFIGIDLNLVSPEDVEKRIEVDRDIFSRVLANLFWNALQHAPKGSEIEVGYEPGSNGHVHLFVGNRGSQIQPEDKELLFDKFVSGNRDIKNINLAGSGLGLAFCKLATEAHEGGIAIESPWEKYGDGVKVNITLPLPRTAPIKS
ncbi:MAG: HAMP domain-containing sensor histidine kinase, partial [Verrucomicrobiota bacterium]